MALTLANILIEREYQVLIVDLDIIGTRIDSTFLASNKEKIHEVTKDGEAVNLLGLFKNDFMAGNNIPAFEPAGTTSKRGLSYEKGKCNVIGSNIYDGKASERLLEDPRILYDAYHSYWMLELVKGLSKSFATAVGKNGKVAVILDCSPGFSSLEKVLNDFLTDIGPDKGKVILVSTIDPQDLAACRQSQESIEKLVEDKTAAGQYYRTLMNGGEGQELSTEAFKSVWNSLCVSNGKEPEYYANEHDRREIFTNILVNKVPRIVYEQLFKNDILHRDDETAAPFLNHLLYFFSNPLLNDKGIQHKMRIGAKVSDYKLSCDIFHILEDNDKYERLCDLMEQSGQGNLFKRDWAPLFPFEVLMDYLKDEDVLADDSERGLSYEGIDLKLPQVRIENEVELVKRFVKKNLKPTSSLLSKMDEVAAYIVHTLAEAEEKNMDTIPFDPDLPKFAKEAMFVVSFGLAVYRLHIYKIVYTAINELIKYCFSNIEDMETMDADGIDKSITDYMEGRSTNLNFREKIAEIFSSNKNARELESSILQIIKSWE